MTPSEEAEAYDQWATRIETDLDQLRQILPPTLARTHDGNLVVLLGLVHLAADFRQVALLARHRAQRMEPKPVPSVVG
jgi:hypothetical protein